MTVRYVYSAAAGAANGTSWTNAYTTLAAALTASAAGDRLFVAHDHAETQGSAMTLTSPGTVSTPVEILCASRSGSVPPVDADLATTATVATTGNFGITCVGYANVRGIEFKVGSGNNSPAMSFSSTSAMGWRLFWCKISMLGTSAPAIILGNSTNLVNSDNRWENVTIKFSTVSAAISLSQGTFIWRGGSLDAAGTIPNSLFATRQRLARFYIEGVDLSAAGSGKTLFLADAVACQVQVKDCKLGASVTKSAQPTAPGPRVIFSRCDSGNTNYTNEIYDYAGTLTVETTIVRTGGATDGTTPIAHKFVTTANASWTRPFRAMPIQFWNETVGSAITATLQGIWGGGAVPNNDDIWIEAEYLGDSSYPLGSFANDTKNSVLASNAAQTAGSGTWGGSTTKFSLDVTFTPQKKGPVTLYVCVGAASSTFYIDPKPIIT